MSPLLTVLFLITSSWEAERLDPADLDATFATVFAKLAAEVVVYPSENYYYWQIQTAAGKTIWGNLRLAADRRDQGELSFAAGRHHKRFSAEDGVEIEKLARLKYAVTYSGKRVLFHLNPLAQELPKKFGLLPAEHFVQRTYDESGLQFILLYNSKFKDFLWVLNEEEGVEPNETLTAQNGALVGKRSGFVFWQDRDRKVLAAVSLANIRANNYFDGPFDQLADNYAKETSIKNFLTLRNPGIADQIDEFGNYKNRQPPTRVALTNYFKYETVDQATEFIRDAIRSGSPYENISKGGRTNRSGRGGASRP